MLHSGYLNAHEMALYQEDFSLEAKMLHDYYQNVACMAKGL